MLYTTILYLDPEMTQALYCQVPFSVRLQIQAQNNALLLDMDTLFGLLLRKNSDSDSKALRLGIDSLSHSSCLFSNRSRWGSEGSETPFQG